MDDHHILRPRGVGPAVCDVSAHPLTREEGGYNDRARARVRVYDCQCVAGIVWLGTIGAAVDRDLDALGRVVSCRLTGIFTASRVNCGEEFEGWGC